MKMATKLWLLFDQLIFTIKIWTFKAAISTALGMLRLFCPSYCKSIAPTYTKRYKAHPSLECRVFIPREYKRGTQLPLYINIHGGGFSICDPQTDDHFCRPFSDKHGFCVVSINYRKAPRYPYPYGVNDCATLAKAVLADEDLPVDHNKVILGGFSAGANLCLVIAQFPGILERIKGLVPIYPVVDFSGQTPRVFRVTKDGRDDTLKRTSSLFVRAYIPLGVDPKVKSLSVIYATRDDLPQKIFFVGAEYDCLCHDANVMAKKLAGIDDSTEPGSEWRQNGIKWEMIPDVQHGFTHINRKGAEEIERLKICDGLYDRISEWIKQEVF